MCALGLVAARYSVVSPRFVPNSMIVCALLCSASRCMSCAYFAGFVLMVASRCMVVVVRVDVPMGCMCSVVWSCMSFRRVCSIWGYM